MLQTFFVGFIIGGVIGVLLGFRVGVWRTAVRSATSTYKTIMKR